MTVVTGTGRDRPVRDNDPVTMAVPKFRSSAFRARLIAALTAVGGVLILLTTIPRLEVWLGRFSAVVTPFGIREASYVASVVIGVGLLTLAGQLDRRKHLAWLVTIVLFALSVWFNLSRGHHPASSGYSLLMVGLLWFTRDEFRAPGDPPTLLEFLRWTTIWFSAVLVYGMAALYFEQRPPLPDSNGWPQPRDGDRRAGRRGRAVHLPTPSVRRCLLVVVARARRQRTCRRHRVVVPTVRGQPGRRTQRLGPRLATGPPVRVRHARLLRAA